MEINWFYEQQKKSSFCILSVKFNDSAQTIQVVSHLYRQITIAWWQTNQKRVASSRINQPEIEAIE